MRIEDKRQVDLGFFTRLDLGQQQVARRLLKLICDPQWDFAPTQLDDGKRWIPIDLTGDLEGLVKRWKHWSSVLMRREMQPESQAAISTRFAASGFNTVSLWVEETYLQSQLHTEDLLRMSIELYVLISPSYGSIHRTQDALEMATVHDPKYGKTIVPTDLKRGLPGVFWANFFGPEYVELVGRQRLLSAPCKVARELPDGGVLILLASSPLALPIETIRARQRAFMTYLGEDLFYHWGQSTAARVPQFRSNPVT